MPRIATQAFTFKMYQGDRPWEPEEQSLFEQQLSQMGVPANDQEWGQFARLMNTERTGVHLKFRYKALTKALQEQENNNAASASTSETTTKAKGTAEDEEENLLKWWLEIGLKDFDEQNKVLENQMYVYDEKEDDYEYENKNDREDNEVDEDNEQRVEIELSPKNTGLEIALEGNV